MPGNGSASHRTSPPLAGPVAPPMGLHAPLDNAAAYASIIRSYASVGDESGAEGVMKQLEDGAVRPDVVMYNALLGAYAVNGNHEGAERVLDRMGAGGGGSGGGGGSIAPNAGSYDTVISAYAKDGDWQGASNVLRRMLQNRNVQPTVTTYNAVISAFANKGCVVWLGRVNFWCLWGVEAGGEVGCMCV